MSLWIHKWLTQISTENKESRSEARGPRLIFWGFLGCRKPIDAVEFQRGFVCVVFFRLFPKLSCGRKHLYKGKLPGQTFTKTTIWRYIGHSQVHCLGILAHLLRMVIEPKYYAEVILWQYAWFLGKKFRKMFFLLQFLGWCFNQSGPLSWEGKTCTLQGTITYPTKQQVGNSIDSKVPIGMGDMLWAFPRKTSTRWAPRAPK